MGARGFLTRVGVLWPLSVCDFMLLSGRLWQRLRPVLVAALRRAVMLVSLSRG